jgi:carbamoyl-phosphate synthase small subunit
VFNTGMTGYQEILTDPSYAGQIVVMTYPEIGIYGVNQDDVESAGPKVAGFVVHRAVREPSNQRSTLSLTEYLKRSGILAVEGIDTRALTRHIRTRGAMRGAISTLDLDPERLVARVRESPFLEERDLVQEVSSDNIITHFRRTPDDFRVVVIDAGAKTGIVRELGRLLRDAVIYTVPCSASAGEVLALKPNGILISNGPGDPAVLQDVIGLIRALLRKRIPLVGICLGHQLLGLAIGGKTYKMRFGHRGCNHPVKDLQTGRVLVTTQNHGYAIDPTSLGVRWIPLDDAYEPECPDLLDQNEQVSVRSSTMAHILPRTVLVGESPLGFGKVEITHLSLNDGTLEGLRLHDFPAFSVQYHPEASPGPHDARFFFSAFASLMETHRA